MHAALGVLFGEYEPDEIASRHKEFGLEEGDSTLWVAAADEPAEPGEWLAAPFDQADPQRVVCRFDVSAVFDEHDDGGRGRSGGAAAPKLSPPSPRGLRPRAGRARQVIAERDDHRRSWFRRRLRRRAAAATTAAAPRSRVVRSVTGISATARASAWSAPCTTDRWRSPRLKAV